MLPEEKARVKIDEKLNKSGWYVVDRDEYAPHTTSAIREASRPFPAPLSRKNNWKNRCGKISQRKGSDICGGRKTLF